MNQCCNNSHLASQRSGTVVYALVILQQERILMSVVLSVDV